MILVKILVMPAIPPEIMKMSRGKVKYKERVRKIIVLN